VEIFLQTGAGSEASVKHLHWHVVPSQLNDPLRGFDKLGQFFTIEKDKPKIVVFPVPIKKARQTLLRALSKTLGKKGKKK
jgi:diadenosine tetraphosphate (Ap4A) HIT family hydrolase